MERPETWLWIGYLYLGVDYFYKLFRYGELTMMDILVFFLGLIIDTFAVLVYVEYLNCIVKGRLFDYTRPFQYRQEDFRSSTKIAIYKGCFKKEKEQVREELKKGFKNLPKRASYSKFEKIGDKIIPIVVLIFIFSVTPLDHSQIAIPFMINLLVILFQVIICIYLSIDYDFRFANELEYKRAYEALRGTTFTKKNEPQNLMYPKLTRTGF